MSAFEGVISMDVWDKYGHWDDIASNADFEYIKQKITGHNVRWKPNYFSSGLLYLLQSHNYLTQDVVALDFGCGLGRNASALKRFFPRVAGYDLPEMIEKYAAFYEEHRRPYDAVYSDLNQLIDKEHITILYDSVVFQHIIDEQYTRSILTPLLETSMFSTVVSVKNHPIHETRMLSILKERKWKLTYTETESLSFDGAPHDVVVMVRP